MSDAATATNARRAALDAAKRWRLPFSRQPWRGGIGNWLGLGTGSSIDFQDHRSYVPGDDPRHIHWQAYARTGMLTMKMFRAEVAPMVDIVVDVSGSMTLTAEKASRTDELVAFCVEAADCGGAPVRVHSVAGRKAMAIDADEVRSGRWRERQNPPSADDRTAGEGLASIPWRPGALKILISDLLFPSPPAQLLAPLAASGAGMILAPALAEEADLPWRGNVELTDCETGAMRRQRIDDALAARYRAAYARHFALWRDACRRRGVVFAQIPCAGALAVVLGGEPYSAGAVEAIG